MKSLMSWIITIGVFLCGVIAILAISAPANATGSGPTTPTQTSTTVYASDSDTETWKYVVGGAVVACVVLSIWKQRWCWEDKTPEPLPDPGPAVKDVTPSNLSDDGAVYIFKGR